MSALVDKYNHVNKRQTRIIVISDRGIYNFATKGFFDFLKGRLRRRISYSIIYGLTVSRHGSEFVVHIPKQHDYRLSSQSHKLQFVQSICKGFCQYHKSDMPCFYTDDIALTIYTTTITDKKKGMSRLPRDKPIYLNPQTIKKNDQVKGASKLIFNKKGDDIKLEQFKLVKTLGRGAFGKVMLCQKSDTKQLFAVKSLRKENLIQSSSVDKVVTQRKLLETAAHPFIMSLIYCFQTKEKIFFIMKFIRGGQLYHHLKIQKKFKQQTAKFYAAQVIQAINYIHQSGFVYRDIKPQNILLDLDGYLLLTDFGLAKQLKKTQLTMTTVGTAQYMAPQIINRKGHNYMADWWSVGILIYQMTQGKTPFVNSNQSKIYQNIINSPIYFSNQSISSDCKDLVKRFLDKNPNQRIGIKGIQQIKSHSWFQGFQWQKLIKKQLKPTFIPDVKSDDDVKNFDDQFTKEQAINSVIQKSDMILLKKYQGQFQGMTYMPQ